VAPSLNPALGEAYQALETGNLDTSQRLYNQVLQGDPNNVDALLGSAAIATQKSDSDSAAKHYMRVLQVDPRNTLAQAGLIGMLGRADPLAAETRVKQLIAREPSAYLYFTLGNIYVDQNRWPDAQQAYFQAHHLQPDNPDYAYNLAVGLEHLGQPRMALNFYRRATQLAAAKGRANFSTGAALERIGQLEKAPE
jgi:tetratricopeptide (TPR) repeat protein